MTGRQEAGRPRGPGGAGRSGRGFGPGERIGTYEVIRLLGRGGMGEVYLARSRGGRPVAVKTLLTDGSLGTAERKRFAREIALAGRVNGAYTADVIDADPEAEVPWMATEYIAAPSLADLVRRCGVLPPPAVLWIGAGITEALGSLHAEGIVHRDLKPANILLPRGGPRLIDFGISHAADLTRTEVTLGTVAFTSPEQARGEPSSSASDVYALGVTLFHLAVGRPPYPPGEPLQLLVRVAEGGVELDGIPEELWEPVSACLRFRPADRIRPAELLEAFAEHIDTRPDAVGGADWLPEVWRDRIARYERLGGPSGEGAVAGEPAAPAKPTVPYGKGTVAPVRRSAPRPAGTAPPAGARPAGTRSARARPAGARSAGSRPAPGRVRPAGRPPVARGGVFASWSRVLMGSAVLVVLGVVAAMLLSGNDPGSKDSGDAVAGESSPFYSPATTVVPEAAATDPDPVVTTEEAPTPTRSADDFVIPEKGQCVDLAGADDPNVAMFQPWTKKELHQVSCTSKTAYMQVTEVFWEEGKCPEGAGLGEFQDSEDTDNAEDPSVCLKRQYRVGQCFPGLDAHKESDSRAQILAVQPCRRSELSQLNNTMYKITGVFQGTSAAVQRRCPGGFLWVLKERHMVICASAI